MSKPLSAVFYASMILAFIATPAAACPWATKGYSAKDSNAEYRFIFSPKCDILVLSIDGSDPKEVQLRPHPKGWFHTTKSGLSFVFGTKGKRVTRIDARGQKSLRMKSALWF